MKRKNLVAAILAASLLAVPAYADDHVESDHMQMRFQQMQGVYDRMLHVHSNAERHKLMDEHMQMMQDQMVDMQKAYGPGMMMRHQGDTNVDLESQMRLMQQRMDMLQQMMMQQMQQQRIMMQDLNR